MSWLHSMASWRLSIDDWADKVTELSGDEVMLDPIEDLIVTLQRKGVVTDREATELYGDYLLKVRPSSPTREGAAHG